jgi:poly-gamma-glutamate capsule biosynthesis protein CapA/YwtB (metallophosphatase superfamily)
MGTAAVAGAGAVVARSIGVHGPRAAPAGTTSGAGSAPVATGASPTASSAAPATTPTPMPKRGSLLIHAGGDTNLDPNYIPAFRTYGYEHAWTGLDGLFERDDLSLVNCECAVSDRGSKYPGKQFNFRGDPAALPAMKAAGIDVANLGNNHAYDYGPEALLDSVTNLDRHGIAPVGAGKDPKAANAPAMFERNGWTIAVVGFDKVVDPYPTAVARPGHPGTADGHDLEAMVRATAAAKRDVDLVLVAIHWGVELDTVPRADDVILGKRLVEAGADVIFGGHAHRLQPMGGHAGRPIFYSLGNFVWPNFSVAGATSAVAEVRVTPQGRVRGRMLPAYIASPGHPVLR